MGESLKKKNPLLLPEENAKTLGFKAIAGIDEAGRGPLAGPVVAASVILKDFNFSARIDDSKKLSPSMRERAYNEILKKAVVGIGIVPEDIIDRINILRATILAMEEAVLNLSTPPDLLMIDGNISLRFNCPQMSIIGGDRKSISIACASIIAKVTRDRLLKFYFTFNRRRLYLYRRL